MKGTVKFYDYGKRFGFIAGADGQDYYFALPEGERINAGCAVEFDAAQNRKGLVAENVQRYAPLLRGFVRTFHPGRGYGFITSGGQNYYFRLPRHKWVQINATVEFRHDPSLPGEAPVAVDVVQLAAPKLVLAPTVIALVLVIVFTAIILTYGVTSGLILTGAGLFFAWWIFHVTNIHI